LVHCGIALSLLLVVSGSSLGVDTTSSMQLRTEGLDSTLDTISTATVAAAVAQKADVIIATDADANPETLDSKVTLP
jgi:hypothetical protein